MEPSVGTGDSPELAEVPGVATGDGLDLDKGLADDAVLRGGPSNCVSAYDRAELSDEPGVGTGNGQELAGGPGALAMH